MISTLDRSIPPANCRDQEVFFHPPESADELKGKPGGLRDSASFTRSTAGRASPVAPFPTTIPLFLKNTRLYVNKYDVIILLWLLNFGGTS